MGVEERTASSTVGKGEAADSVQDMQRPLLAILQAASDETRSPMTLPQHTQSERSGEVLAGSRSEAVIRSGAVQSGEEEIVLIETV